MSKPFCNQTVEVNCKNVFLRVLSQLHLFPFFALFASTLIHQKEHRRKDEIQRDGERKRKRERECVCVCEREREREGDREGL